MKKLLTLLLIAVMSLSITACSSDKKESSSTKEATKQVTKKKEKKVEPLDLKGTWQCDPADGTYMKATISDNVIEIDWVMDEGKTNATYWVGSYDAPTTATNEYSWTSNNDHEKTETALLASSDDTKVFNYKDGIISFTASMQGVTKTIELKKQ